MDLPLNPPPAPAVTKVDTQQAAQALGKLLRQTSEYKAFWKALKAVNSDLTVQKLGEQLRAHKNSLRWSQDSDGQHAVELARLEREIEDLPNVQEYRQAEAQARQLFYAVDEIISQEAGMTFAVNAKRSGCCG